MDGLFYAANLFAACNTRPSYASERKDKKFCCAKPGECRCNDDFYTPGLGDAKSWKLPIANERCPASCWDLKAPADNAEAAVTSYNTANTKAD